MDDSSTTANDATKSAVVPEIEQSKKDDALTLDTDVQTKVGGIDGGLEDRKRRRAALGYEEAPPDEMRLRLLERLSEAAVDLEEIVGDITVYVDEWPVDQEGPKLLAEEWMRAGVCSMQTGLMQIRRALWQPKFF